MLSDSTQKRKPTRKRAVSAEHSRWGDTQKIECAKSYLLLGNLRQTAVVLKIPEATVRKWATSDWWKELIHELKSQEKLVLNNKLKNLAEKSLVVMEDRLDKGDFIYNQKEGKLVRKPVALRDVHKVATDMIALQGKLQTEDQEKTTKESIEESLKRLAKVFEENSQKQIDNKPPVIEVTDVVFVKE